MHFLEVFLKCIFFFTFTTENTYMLAKYAPLDNLPDRNQAIEKSNAAKTTQK